MRISPPWRTPARLMPQLCWSSPTPEALEEALNISLTKPQHTPPDADAEARMISISKYHCFAAESGRKSSPRGQTVAEEPELVAI
eukprot:5275465-Prymnesium_polylepis.1